MSSWAALTLPPHRPTTGASCGHPATWRPRPQRRAVGRDRRTGRVGCSEDAVGCSSRHRDQRLRRPHEVQRAHVVTTGTTASWLFIGGWSSPPRLAPSTRPATPCFSRAHLRLRLLRVGPGPGPIRPTTAWRHRATARLRRHQSRSSRGPRHQPGCLRRAPLLGRRAHPRLAHPRAPTRPGRRVRLAGDQAGPAGGTSAADHSVGPPEGTALWSGDEPRPGGRRSALGPRDRAGRIPGFAGSGAAGRGVPDVLA